MPAQPVGANSALESLQRRKTESDAKLASVQHRLEAAIEEYNCASKAIVELETRMSVARDRIATVTQNPELINDGHVYSVPVAVCLVSMFLAGSVGSWILITISCNSIVASIIALPVGLAAAATFQRLLVPNTEKYYQPKHYGNELTQVYQLLRDAKVRRENACGERDRDQVVHDQILNDRATFLPELERLMLKDRHDRQIAEQKMRCEAFRLSNLQWRDLRGTKFEDFFAEIMELFGFIVDRTKVTGDQGVDLIGRRHGTRVAVQCKGYAGSVGNSAVQESHAGMSHYDCQESWCVTNSYFTPSSEKLAKSVKCRLLDGDAILRLLNGNSSL